MLMILNSILVRRTSNLFALTVLGGCILSCADVSRPSSNYHLVSAGCLNSRLLADIKPKVNDISSDGSTLSPLFDGQWYSKRPYSRVAYRDEDGRLAMQAPAELSTVSRDFRLNKMPLLSGNQSFYVEVVARISSNDLDHWPAIWLMPIEHNKQQADHLPSDPPGFERWSEIDIDEGGFGPGLHGTLHNWSGIWPNFQTKQRRVIGKLIDRTLPHRFGLFYDFPNKKMEWILDGSPVGSLNAAEEMAISKDHHFYLIFSANSRGEKNPYVMYLERVRTFSCASN